MTFAAARLAGMVIVLSAALAEAPAKGGSGLTRENFVDAGDAIAEMLGTSGMAFSVLSLGASADVTARPRFAAFHPSPSAAAAFTYETPCPGGGRVIGRVRDADASGDLSTADRFVTLFESCLIDGRVITGSGEFVVAAHRFEGHTEVTELDFRFKDLGSDEMRWSGPARIALTSDLTRGTEHYLVTYRDLVVTRGPKASKWAFSLDLVRPPIGAQVVSIKGAMTIGELRLRLRQDDPFVMPISNFPQSGLITATDEHGARLQVEAGRWRYAYRLYRAGNAGDTPDAKSQSRGYGRR